MNGIIDSTQTQTTHGRTTYVPATRKDTDTTTSTLTPPHVSVSDAKPCDIPALVAIELPAFIDDDVSAHMLPSHAEQFKAGVDPTKWPDYHRTMHERRWYIAQGLSVFKATIREDWDDCGLKSRRQGKAPEKIVGMAVMIPPSRLMHSPSMRDKILNKYICPAFFRLRQLLPNSIRGDGLDMEFEEKLRDTVLKERQEVMGGREFYFLCVPLRVESFNFADLVIILSRCLFCVSNEYQNRGIGSALLAHCTELANKQGIPILIESTQAGLDFYKNRGFKDVKVCELEYKGETIRWPMMLKEPEKVEMLLEKEKIG
jgi:N-acetylglutamate synthase-like GNAT family acetyltransferase